MSEPAGMNKNGIVAVAVVMTAVVLVGLWVMRSGQTRPGGRQFDCTAPPQAPVGLAYTKTGNVIEGTWQAPADGDRPTYYVVEVGGAPGLNDRGTFIVPATELRFGGPTPADSPYFARVFARNACGTSPASNEVTYTVP
jgi:hypothetical protein